MDIHLSYLLFCSVILFANIMQGITGFAGTILALPVSLMLVGYATARPILNVLGILSGIYVAVLNRHDVVWKELLKVCLVMLCGILLGIFLKKYVSGKERILYIALGIFIILLSIQRMAQLFIHPKKIAVKNDGSIREIEKTPKHVRLSLVKDYAVLVFAGLIHGIFVCGGPLLIGYLSKILKERKQFRATISCIWIFLNFFILVSDAVQGYWSYSLFKVLLMTVPFLWGGMKIGSLLYAYMNQKIFMLVTYILLFVSGLTLLIK